MNEQLQNLINEDYERMIGRLDAELLLDKIFATSKFDSKTIEILKLRFYRGMLYKDIAEQYNVSQQRIKQIVKKAFDTMESSKKYL